MTRTLLILDPDAQRYARRVAEAGVAGLRVLQSSDAGALPDGFHAAEIVLGPPQWIAPVLPCLRSLRWVQSTWAGVEPLLQPTGRRDYLLSGVKGIFGSQMAEYVLCYMLMHQQRALQRLDAQRARRWDKITSEPLADREVVILGTGSIGREIARRCVQCGMRTCGVNRGGENPGPFSRVMPASTLVEAASMADFLVMALPGTTATRHLVDRRVIAALPTHAVLINVGRGNTLDTRALAAALAAGRLGGAVLDVLEQEPPAPDDPLWQTPGLLITAHVSAVSHVQEIAPLFLDNLRRYLSGDRPLHLVDFQRGY